jgi:hypothetical protein
MSIKFIYSNLLTTEDVCDLFAVKPMTVWNWRQIGDDPFPTVHIAGNKRPNIRFEYDAIVEWSDRNGKILNREAAERIIRDKGVG